VNFLLYRAKGVGRKIPGGTMEKPRPRNSTNKPPSILSVVC